MATVTLDNLSMQYGSNGTGYAALSQLSLNIREGDFISLIGLSGCGKSTITDIVSGLKKPTGGEVRIDNEPVSGPGPGHGVPGLFPLSLDDYL